MLRHGCICGTAAYVDRTAVHASGFPAVCWPSDRLRLVHAWPVTPSTEPDDAVLLELGRLTWAAINLEDIVPQMRRALGPEPDRLARAPAADWIKDALKVLSGWPESAIREIACRWFNAAQEALEQRNSVLHSVPGIWVTIKDGAVTTHGPVLEHLPKRKGGSYRRISLAEDELRLVRQKLADAREGWVEVFFALDGERKRVDGDHG